jgi:hypothetical protein
LQIVSPDLDATAGFDRQLRLIVVERRIAVAAMALVSRQLRRRRESLPPPLRGMSGQGSCCIPD